MLLKRWNVFNGGIRTPEGAGPGAIKAPLVVPANPSPTSSSSKSDTKPAQLTPNSSCSGPTLPTCGFFMYGKNGQSWMGTSHRETDRRGLISSNFSVTWEWLASTIEGIKSKSYLIMILEKTRSMHWVMLDQMQVNDVRGPCHPTSAVANHALLQHS